MSLDLGPFSKAADAVLRSDRAKEAEFGGQKLAAVERVDVGLDESELVAVVATAADGRKANGIVMPMAINRPKDRELRAADVHDAVQAALLTAAESLSNG